MTIQQRSAQQRRSAARLRSIGVVSVLGFGLLVSSVYASAPADAAGPRTGDDDAGLRPESNEEQPGDVDEADPLPDLDELEIRVRGVNDAWDGLARYYDSEIAPIERVLHRFSGDSALVADIAVALVREANRVEIEPRLLLAVLLVENPWLDPEIRSPVGAIGLMQVMPIHRGGWPQCGYDLEDIDANICHGAQIFAHYFRRSGRDLDRALLRYNGCVNGTNTPDCHQYPNHVFANAGRASVMTWMGQGPVGGSL